MVGCQHKAAKGVCQAERLSPDDLMMNFNRFYERPNKVEQDREILHLLDVTPVKRKRNTENTGHN